MNKFKECNQCPHEFNDKNLEPCKDCVPKKKTNADKIRAMSDEELAEFASHYISCGYCDVKTIGGSCGNGCKKNLLKWLQSEAE